MNGMETIYIISGLFLAFVVYAGIFIVSSYRVDQLEKFAEIPEANANGKILTDRRLYAQNPAEAAEHLIIQHEKSEEADEGEPFYCNTFTGAKKRRYNRVYRETLEQKEAEKHKELEEKRMEKAVRRSYSPKSQKQSPGLNINEVSYITSSTVTRRKT